MKVDVIGNVFKYIHNARNLVPAVTNDMLDSNGAIYYMNGNDGTDFDWNVNDHLCEFMVFGKNEVGFIKVYVNKNDTICGWIYEDFGMRPTHTLETMKLNEGDAKKLALQMYQIADKKGIWDSTLAAMNFYEDVSCEWEYLLSDDDDEDDEEWEDCYDEDEDDEE